MQGGHLHCQRGTAWVSFGYRGEGIIAAIVVPGPCKLLGVAGRKDDYVIPWSCVKKVGPDIILVDIKPCDCRVPRPKGKFPL